LFDALRADLGGLPVIAEDLGEITPPVHELRERLGLPGMRVLQFAFGGAVEERFLPHAYDRHCVAYTGTHDNDTTRGWYEALQPAEKAALHEYAPEAEADPVGAVIRLAWASVADWAIAPAQDLLELGSGARMNLPGTPAGNWGWRLDPGGPTPDRWARLAGLTATYGRGPRGNRSD
jgi:4-alpha-glucanotransferase